MASSDVAGVNEVRGSEIPLDASVSAAVVEAVAEAADEPVTAMPPLNEAVDPDALEHLFAPRFDGTPRSHGRVSFPYNGFQVTVESGETVTVESLDD